MEIGDRVAVVTGAASGIGRAVAVALAREGAKVVVADVDQAGGLGTLRAISGVGGDAVLQPADVTRAEDLEAMVAAAQRHFGGLDILCNNAGIGEGKDDLFGEDGGWQRLVDINLTAVIAGTRLGVRAMRERGLGGVIVNVGSMGGLRPMPAAPVYAATKAAVIHFTRSLAHLKDTDGIRVNAVCPSFVDTPLLGDMDTEQLAEMTARLGLLQPAQVADGVLELVRDESRAGAIMRVTAARGIDYAPDLRP